MADKQTTEATLRALFHGPDDVGDPLVRDVFRQLADDLAPKLASLADTLATPQEPSVVRRLPPTTARGERRRLRDVERALQRLEDGVASGKYIRREDVLTRIGQAIAALRQEIVDGVATARARVASGDWNADDVRTYLATVTDSAAAKLDDVFPERRE